MKQKRGTGGQGFVRPAHAGHNQVTPRTSLNVPYGFMRACPSKIRLHLGKGFVKSSVERLREVQGLGF